MLLIYILCIFTVINGAERSKRSIWYMYVDEIGNPVPENTYIPQVFPANAIPHYPVSHQWRVQENIFTEQDVHLRREEADAKDYYVGNQLQICKAHEFQCTSPKQCIPEDKRCNNYVDCTDGTDEIGCECHSRLSPSKFCDFFNDCPNGEDELGCFGCDKDEFSCYNSREEYEEQSSMRQCYKHIHKCDRIAKCSNAKDEFYCSVIAEETQSPTHSLVPTIDGILYHHYQGVMYPVCQNFHSWTDEVCESMMGANFGHSESEYVPTRYEGEYISTARIKGAGLYTFSITDKCPGKVVDSGNVVLHVTCIAKSKCGDNQFDRVKNEGSARVAGGHETLPGSNPWLVGLFMNGTFTCGGNIISNKWVLTAAHCLYIRRTPFSIYDYLEVRSGIQRLFSFSKNEQAVRVIRGIIHKNYIRESLENDIALLELADDLKFNKWVQPICLPTNKMVGDSQDRGWILGPQNSNCKIAGWGGHTWRGPFPVDRQMETTIDIASGCNQTNEKVICAGYEQGGYDTCVGDSGGPFVCQSKENIEDIYLAGIVSGGYSHKESKWEDVHCGEKETYGTYTGLTWYINWIEQMQANETYGRRFRQTCPGVKCSSTNHCAIRNGIVDCIGGEDEI